MNLFNLKEKVAIVTGGNGGIGLAYAKGLVKAGAKVAIWGRNSAKNELAKKELESFGGEIMIFAADLTNAAEAREAFKATIAHFGKVDICFANAGAPCAIRLSDTIRTIKIITITTPIVTPDDWMVVAKVLQVRPL